jgi:hypothetical protein
LRFETLQKAALGIDWRLVLVIFIWLFLLLCLAVIAAAAAAAAGASWCVTRLRHHVAQERWQ